MGLSFEAYIAGRYLKAKRKETFISLISVISVAGVALGVMALIVVMSVMNGFRQDIRKHIDDIANKYIIPEETSDGAVMFIPAESVFAEIHAHYPDLVEEAYRRRVWLVSPTTMMAILTTARAVLKDAATREQVHIIQQHLNMLSKDFVRFQSRMDKLASHIRQAHKDVDVMDF